MTSSPDFDTNPIGVRSKRPWEVLILGPLLTIAGAVGIAYQASELDLHGPFVYDTLWVCLVNAVAIVSGIYMLLGRNWARWLALIWIGCHVVLSFFHSMGEVAAHTLLLLLFAWFLFRPKVTAYFRNHRGLRNADG